MGGSNKFTYRLTLTCPRYADGSKLKLISIKPCIIYLFLFILTPQKKSHNLLIYFNFIVKLYKLAAKLIEGNRKSDSKKKKKQFPKLVKKRNKKN